jgi:hypothetical protein
VLYLRASRPMLQPLSPPDRNARRELHREFPERLGWSDSKVSRIETGKLAVQEEDLRLRLRARSFQVCAETAAATGRS